MSRRKQAQKREFVPDPKFKSVLVTQFINNLLRQGKKRLAETMVYYAIDMAGERVGMDGLSVFKKAIDNVKPTVEVKSRRVGGANYQVPVEVRPSRRMALAMRWMREAARKRSEKSMGQRLAAEMLEAAENRGGAVKKRDEVHRMADANKAFAHFRF